MSLNRRTVDIAVSCVIPASTLVPVGGLLFRRGLSRRVSTSTSRNSVHRTLSHLVAASCSQEQCGCSVILGGALQSVAIFLLDFTDLKRVGIDFVPFIVVVVGR